MNEKKYKGLRLSKEKLKEVTVKPKVKDGKALVDRNIPSHRYIMDDED